MPTPPANAKTSTFQVGTYTALTDTFNLVLDLNDGATWWISQGKLKLDQPDKVDNRSFNLRTSGERVVRTQYKNRHIQASVNLRGASTSAMLASVRALIAAIEHPDTNPYSLRLALPGAALYTYADVVRIKHNIPADPLSLLALAIPHVELDFECRPFLRGDRLTLSNLVPNPGFEAPFGGGTATVAPVAFADALNNVSAYSVLAGSAPTTGPANTYVDLVLATANGGANLLRYYRLDESSGTSAYDIGGTGQTGTYNGSPTLGVAGAISGDTDTAITLNGSTQFVSLPTTGLPTGTAAWSVGCWVKLSATPSTFACVATWGTNTANQRAEMGFNSGGQPYVGFGGGAVATGVVLTNNVWHLVMGTFDGAHTLTLYVDGAQVAQNTSATGGNIVSGVAYLGQFAGATGKLAASLDEAKIWSAALTSTAIANLYTAGHSGASGVLANAMSVPSGTLLQFGSPAWGAIQTWQVRFRWNSAATEFDFFVHRVDANNALYVAVTRTQLLLGHLIGGVWRQVAPATTAMTNGGYYWLQLTQFPAPSGVTPYVQATLSYDADGAIGSQIAQIGGFTFDAVTALSGQSALTASGASLVVGGTPGNASGAGQQVSLFGPGGWTGVPSGGNAPAALAWEQNIANTAAAALGATNSGNGNLVQVPVTSFGAARIDAPAAGSSGFTGLWQSAPPNPSVSQLQQSGIPVKSGGDTLQFGGMLRATGNGSGYWAYVQVNEYTSAGAFVTGTQHTLASGSGAIGWQAWQFSQATQATTAYVAISLVASDTTASSALSSTWYDNVQVWDQTATGQGAGSMPYCELRFPSSPAQLLVSGLLGDVESPAEISIGTYETSVPAGTTFSVMLGRRGTSAGAHAVLCGNAGNNGQPSVSDATSYGGFYINRAAAATQVQDLWIPYPADTQGFYGVFGRAQTAQTSGNLPNISVRATGFQTTSGVLPISAAGALAGYYSVYTVKPFGSSGLWTAVNAGPLWLPLFPAGPTTDLTQYGVSVEIQYPDATSGGAGAAFKANWLLLLPADGSLLMATVNNPSNSGVGISGTWLWVYADGLGWQQGELAAVWTYGLTGPAIATPSTGAGGPGTATSGYPNVNPASDPLLTLDPTLAVSGVANGVNQLAGLIADQNAQELPLYTEMQYSPLYLYPR